MKRKTAREILAESFRELAQSKPVDSIVRGLFQYLLDDVS